MAAATQSLLVVFSLLLCLSFSFASRVPPSPKENEETNTGEPDPDVVGIGSGKGGGNGATEFGSGSGSVFRADGGGLGFGLGRGSGGGSIGQKLGNGDGVGGCLMPNILIGTLLQALLGGLQGGVLGAQEGMLGAILLLGAQGAQVGLQGEGGSSWLRQVIPYLTGSDIDFLKTYGTSPCPVGCVPNPPPSQTAEHRAEPSREAQTVVEPKKATSAANEAQEPMPIDMLDLKNKPQGIRP